MVGHAPDQPESRRARFNRWSGGRSGSSKKPAALVSALAMARPPAISHRTNCF
jgi:hypothetical protein